MNTFVDIKQLPAPSTGRTGWPWTETSSSLPDTMPSGAPWPRLSIVTPSFNQGQFLEETIRSVLLQNYPNLEYIIIDGGSTDNSIEIIKKYEPWISYWVSESDRGQSHAINKGLARCTGEIFNWINSDDLLLPDALSHVARAFEGYDAVGGGVINFGDGDEELVVNSNLTPLKLIPNGLDVVFHQPGLWLRPELIKQCGGIDERFHFTFDWDLVIRYFILFPKVAYLSEPLASFRLHEDSKTVSSQEKFTNDRIKVLNKLRRLPRFEALHRASNYYYRLAHWWTVLNAATAQPRQPRLPETLRLARLALNDPMIRCSIKTAGAIRRVLLNRP